MRVKLELDRNEWQFSDHRTSVGDYRCLLIHVDGRPFSTWYRVDDYRMHDKDYMENVDRVLAVRFEQMISSVLTRAMKMVPVGLDLLSCTDDEFHAALRESIRQQVEQ